MTYEGEEKTQSYDYDSNEGSNRSRRFRRQTCIAMGNASLKEND